MQQEMDMVVHEYEINGFGTGNEFADCGPVHSCNEVMSVFEHPVYGIAVGTNMKKCFVGIL